MKKSFIILTAAVAILVAASCKQEAKQPSKQTYFESTMTAKDTTEVKNLVDQFFSYAISGEYGHAAAMLYKADSTDHRNEPQPLTNDEMAEVRQLLEILPAQDYRIDYIKFSEYYQNEVRCTVVLSPATDDDPEVATQLFFKPLSYLGGWCLTLLDSSKDNTTGIVDISDRDSIAREYQLNEQRRAAQSALQAESEEE